MELTNKVLWDFGLINDANIKTVNATTSERASLLLCNAVSEVLFCFPGSKDNFGELFLTLFFRINVFSLQLTRNLLQHLKRIFPCMLPSSSFSNPSSRFCRLGDNIFGLDIRHPGTVETHVAASYHGYLPDLERPLRRQQVELRIVAWLANSRQRPLVRSTLECLEAIVSDCEVQKAGGQSLRSFRKVCVCVSELLCAAWLIFVDIRILQSHRFARSRQLRLAQRQ